MQQNTQLYWQLLFVRIFQGFFGFLNLALLIFIDNHRGWWLNVHIPLGSISTTTAPA